MQNSQFVAFKKKSLYEQTKSLFEFISVKNLSIYGSLCSCQQQADDRRIEHTATENDCCHKQCEQRLAMIIYTAQSKKHKKMMS